MTQQTINVGTSANDQTGDPLRTAFTKINANFTELYAGGANETQLTNGSQTVTLGADGKLTFPDATQQTTAYPGTKIGGAINIGTTSSNIFIPNTNYQALGLVNSLAGVYIEAGTPQKVWQFNTDGSLTFPDATRQTTAALPYVKTAYNATNGTATLDLITATITNTGGGHVRIYYTTTSVSNITLQFSVMNIGSTGGNGGASFSQNSSSPPFNFGNIDNIGDMQIAYIQDITHQKIYRITGINTYGTVGTTTAYGSILIEQII
jgi:hypothetical protein